MSAERFIYALTDYTVERREAGWYFARSAMRHKAGDWLGPYRSEASVALTIARQLRREIVERYGRQTNGRSPWKVAWNPADPIATWLVLGEQNRWIRRAGDPRFNRESFTHCADAEELRALSGDR